MLKIFKKEKKEDSNVEGKVKYNRSLISKLQTRIGELESEVQVLAESNKEILEFLVEIKPKVKEINQSELVAKRRKWLYGEPGKTNGGK